MNKILVPVDFSPVSAHSMAHAIELARANQAELVALHAYLPAVPEPYMMLTMEDDLATQLEEIARKHFQDMLATLSQEAVAQVAISFRADLGGSVETILRVAEEIDAGLVVMGMRGGNPLAKKIFGSTTSAVLQRIPREVLVVPAQADIQPFDQVIFASDLLDDDLPVIQRLLDLVRPWKGRVQCIHVSGEPNLEEDLRFRHFQQNCQKLEGVECLEWVQVVGNEVVEGLMEQAESRGSTLMAMRTHLRGMFGRWFHGSVTKEMARRTQVPLWVFPMVGELAETEVR